MNSSVIAIISFFNIILSLIIFFNNWRTNKALVFLSGFLIIFSVYNISGSILFLGGPLWLFTILLNNFAPFIYLYPVMFYFYLRASLTNNSSLKKIDFIHFIPFIISFIAVIPYLIKPWSYKYSIAESVMCNYDAYINCSFDLLYPQAINRIARPIQLGIYLITSFVLIFKNIPKLKTSQNEDTCHWKFLIGTLTILTVSFLFYSVMHLLLTTRLIYTLRNEEVYTITHILVSITSYLYLLIPILIILQPKILYGKTVSEPVINDNKITCINKEILKIELDEKQSCSEDENLTRLMNRIMCYMKNDKPYLNPEFSAHDICVKLNIPQHQVQNSFKVVLGKKFTEVKNDLRVEYAINLMKQNFAKSVSMEGIGKSAGFASASNFFLIFKKVTGKTPNEWIRDNIIAVNQKK